MYLIPKLNSSLFDFSTWRAGSVADFGIMCRTKFILANKEVFKKYAIGYCDGDRVPCRPKKNRIAVMFYLNGYHFWNHLLIEEFEEIFKRED